MEGWSAANAPFDPGPLYDTAPCGLLVTAPDGLIRHVNRTFCAWVGFVAADLVATKKLQDLLTMGGRIFHQTHWEPLLQIQGSVSEVKLELVTADGRRLPTVWNAVRRVRHDAVVHDVAVFIAEDRHTYEQELVRARRRAEELLAREHEAREALRVTQADRDRQQALAEDRARFAEQMVAIVSHDLRNPLSVVRMSSHVLRRSALTPDQHLALNRLAGSNERAIRLISDLLDFSSGRLGRGLQVEMGAVNLHGLVGEALQDLRVAHPGCEIDHRQQGSGTCRGDGDRLTQLLGNLATNAIAYGAPDRPVTVTSVVDADGFWIAVHNEGRPIADELRPHLFDPMTRGTARVAGGSRSVGLGLFIVHQIALAHGGTVEVVSTQADGTTFRANFPAAAAPGAD